ncbi:ABC transporter permease [uncultured Parabacteroides sp.]|uniref:ABC transporter permease n=1 Tax=uncultured Parabacteroides sp. TaxID=512312 RepID=UPI0025DDB6E0|nr:FtsX-like permease family protein [uncultured Parabacteroides sp.]
MEYWSQVIKSQRARKSLSALNVFGLSVCVGAALLIMLYVRFELSFDSFHNGDRIYRVESRLYEGATLTDNWATTSFGHAPAMYREIPGIEQYVRVTAQDRGQEVTFGDRQFIEERYCYTEPAFFDLFDFPILKGEKSGQLVRPNTMVITESAARRYFAGGDPIGKVLTFRTSSSEQHFEVTGVIADMPYNSHLHYDFLLSYSTIPEARRDIWYIHGVYTYVRLEPGKKPGDIEAAFHSISGKYKTVALKHKDWRVELVRLRDIHLTPRKSYEKEAKGSRMAVRILSVMVVALLLIGWVNALNLTVARYLERGREFGIRKAFGASRRQVILQGLLEAGLLNVSALILALGWVEVLLPFASRWAGLDFAAGIFRSPEFWGMAASVFVGGTLFTGLYPSFLLVRIRPADIMRGKLLHGRKGNRMRKVLIVAQFLASFVLVSGTLVVIGQVRYMQQETASASSNRVLVVKYPAFTDDMSVKMDGPVNSDRLAEVEQVYRTYFPSALFSYFYLDDYQDSLYKSDRNFGWIFASASLLAVFVACLGLWIVTLFSTLARVKEVGIRKVLGAGKISLFLVLTRELLLLTALATVLGLPVSVVLMNGWLESYAFHIVLPWWVYGVAFVLLMCIAFLTVVRQVWRVVRLKPMRILRNE